MSLPALAPTAGLLWFGAEALKTAAVLALALAARAIMRRTSATHRHAVVAAGLAAALALPMLSVVAPRLTVRVPAAAPVAQVAAEVPRTEAPVIVVSTPAQAPGHTRRPARSPKPAWAP